MPLPLPLRFEAAANSFVRSLILPSSLLFGAISSTSRQATARLPLMPSSMVQKKSAWSRRTLRLSTTRVSPPVPGSTASNGTSGSATEAAPSSARMMWSVASASS